MRNKNWKPFVEDRQAEKEKIRHEILFVQWLFIALFAAMTVFICTYSINNKETLFENDYNGREQLLLEENIRGSIYSADNQVLAETVTDKDGTETRNYPFANVFSHVVGYSTMGKSGLEKAENYTLIHSDLSLSEKAALDEKDSKYEGNSIYTTLDPVIQQAAYDALGAYSGAVIVTDPETGDILAMVSKPDFDPNQIDSMWDTYLSEDNTQGNLLNRVTMGQYPPGSTFKILDAIEYVEENSDTWKSYSFDCIGTFEKDGGSIHCFHYETHGQVDFEKSFAESCNCSFANIGLSLDRSSYENTLKKFMFNSSLPYDYTYEKSTVDLDDTTSANELMQIAIGQGTTSMSPLHMNLITQSVANDGVLMKPRLVESTKTASGTVLDSNRVTEYATLMDESTASTMKTLMQDVVEEGTASKLKGYSYTAAGKTGSAEYDQNDESQSHAWFTGFAPVDDPQYCITVIIEGAGSGGDYAVPIARRVLDACFGQ